MSELKGTVVEGSTPPVSGGVVLPFALRPAPLALSEEQLRAAVEDETRRLLAMTIDNGKKIEAHVHCLETTIDQASRYLKEALELGASQGTRKKFLINLACDLLSGNPKVPAMYWPDELL